MIFQPNTPINSGNVTVPKNFSGMAWSGWPNGLPGVTTATPPITWGTTYNNSYRAWTNGPTDWQQIETSQGVYNWTAMDEWVSAHYARGVDVCLSTFYCPYFYSANPATWASADPVGSLGTGGPLTSLGRTGWGNFITAAVSRYKARGTPLKYLQTWEEPYASTITNVLLPVTTSQGAASVTLTMTNTTGIVAGMGVAHAKVPANTWVVSFVPNTSVTLNNATNSALLTTDGNLTFSSSGGYWWGTYADLIDACYVAYTAAKAADPNIIVLSPSISPPAESVANLQSFWNGTGTVNTTIHGYQTCDWFGVDLFGYWSTNFPKGFDANTPQYATEIWPQNISTILETWVAAMGANVKPICITSLGFGYLGNSNASTIWKAATPLYRKQQYTRFLLEAAANGVKFVIPYSGDSWTWFGGGGFWIWSGDFINDTSGVVAGHNEFVSNVCGKTITFCGYKGDGSMFAAFTDGSTYSI